MRKAQKELKLIDVNAYCGKAAAVVSDFPSLKDRLAFMDRLGIEQALVWNIEASKHHSLSANAALLAELKNTPDAKDRIIPALVVSDLVLYEKNGINTLKRQMEEGNTNALRFVNALNVSDIINIKPVLKELKKYKPFLILSFGTSTPAEIIAFCKELPDVKVIITDVMWPKYARMFNILRSAKNVMLDISWMHVTGDIELVVKHFGADRLVFGIGPRCHNGAAIASLMRADISENERSLIAYGNIEKLLASARKKKTASPALSPITSAKLSLWKEFLQGKRLEIDIIDAHFHIGPSAGYVLENKTEDEQIQLALNIMNKVGMNKAIASGLQALLGDAVKGNDLIEEKFAPYSDRLVAYLGFNPFFANELVARFDKYFSSKVFVGFKTLCSYWGVPITDKRFKPMWEYAEKHHLPVLSHSWGGQLDGPKLFKDLAKDYPNVAFLIGHSGGTNEGRTDLEEIAPNYPNIYMEWCGSFCSNILWEDTLKRVSIDQIVFGTDAMVHNIYWELGRLLSLDITDEEPIVKILGKNMKKILSRRK